MTNPVKYTLLAALVIVTAFACKKKNAEPAGGFDTSVKITSDYKLLKVYGGDSINTEYLYNDSQIVKQINDYAYYQQFHYTGPIYHTIIYSYMKYDNLLRVVGRDRTGFEGFSEFKYSNSTRLPSGRYDKSSHLINEYTYGTNGKVSVINTYDTKGNLVSKESITYNDNGNVILREIQPYNIDTTNASSTVYYTLRTVTKYSEYDNSHTIYDALPGIRELYVTSEALSKNNPLKWESTEYMTGGKEMHTEYNNAYEYNTNHYPLKCTSTSVRDTFTNIAVVKYQYNKQ
jgi:hypothetical protein